MFYKKLNCHSIEMKYYARLKSDWGYNLNYGHDYVMNVNDTQGGTQDGTQGGTQGGTQDKLQKQIFEMIEENPQISTSEIATRLGVGVGTVKRRIKQMTNIVYVGSGYSGHWEIKGE